MVTNSISILHLPKEIRYLQIELTNYIQKRFRSKLLGFSSTPKLKVISETENSKVNGATTSLINFQSRTIFINVNPAFNPGRQWEEALGDTVHENLHDVWDLFPKDQKWDGTKCKLMNIFMDGRNEQYASYKDSFSAELLIGMRKHAFSDLEKTLPRKKWFNGDLLWASSYLSLKIHTGLMATAPELVYEFQSGSLSHNEFWKKVKKVLKLRNPPSKLKWKQAWEIICRFWLAGNIYQKSKLADEFRELYPKPKEKEPKTTSEDRGGHEGIPMPGGGQGDPEPNGGGNGGEESNGGEGEGEDNNQTRPEPNNIPKPGKQKSADDVEQEVNDEKQGSSSCGSTDATYSTIYPGDGRELEEKAKALSSHLKREVAILTAPKKREITNNSNRIRMQKVLKNPNTREPWKKKKEIEINRNVIGLKFIGDTSGSMLDEGKLDAMKLALAVFHDTCSSNSEIEHEIFTSVGLQLIAGGKMSRSRGFNLIEGVGAFGGDDFANTLPQLFKRLSGGKEIVFIFTDGQPGNIAGLATMIEKARKGGVIVFGVGLNIVSASDRLGMKTLFGDDHLLARINQRNGEDFAKKMAASLRNLVRRRLLIN